MRHTRITMAAVAVAAAATAATAPLSAVASAKPSAAAARADTVSSLTTSHGKILVDHNGLALYLFTHDRAGHDTCAKISGCLAVWPAFTTTTRPTAGPGVNARLLGTIKVGSRLQVTYAGHPLYEYAQSSFPGFTSYIGTAEFGGDWDAVSVTGRAIS